MIFTLKKALWTFCTTEMFRDGASQAVNLSDDADMVRDMYGGLAGAWYGIRNIPREWKSGLQAKNMVNELVEDIRRPVKRIQ